MRHVPVRPARPSSCVIRCLTAPDPYRLQVLLALLTVAGLFLAIAPRPLAGQTQILSGVDEGEEQTPVTPGDPELSLDLLALLQEAEVFPNEITEDVWTFSASPGRRLVQIPIIVKPGQTEAELKAPTFGLRAGRFIAWRILPNVAHERNEQQRGGRQSYNFEAALMLDKDADDILGARTQSREGQALERMNTALESSLDSVPYGAPRVTRSITVRPNGRIAWRMDRAIGGGEIKTGDDPYLLKLRPDRLRDLQPERPERGQRSDQQDRREFEMAERAKMQEFRVATEAFRELQRQVRELPDQFETPIPERIWVIYELPAHNDRLTFNGQPPLPWIISVSDLNLLREIAATVQTDAVFSSQEMLAIETISALVRTGHPLSLRLAAYTTRAGGLIPRVSRGDRLYVALQGILNGQDDEARNVVLSRLALIVPPTSATMALLRDAARHMNPAQQLAQLRSLLGGDVTDSAMAEEMLYTANRSLQDASGPEPEAILSQVVGAMRRNRDPELFEQVAQGIDFTRIPTQRRDAAITYVVYAAPTEPLAARWLDIKLLGGTDLRVPRETLNRIHQVAVNTTESQEAPRGSSQNLLSAIFATSRRPATTEGAASEARSPLEVRPIPLNHAGHALYRLLGSSNEEVRDLAWQALPRFDVVIDAPQYQEEQATTTVDDLVRPIVQQGLRNGTAPESLVPFLDRLSQRPIGTQWLVYVMLRADGSVARQVATALLGSNRPIDQILALSDATGRHDLGRKIYEAQPEGVAPLVVGLLRQRGVNAPVVNWFGQQVSAGRLPAPSEWASHFTSDHVLLEMAGANDSALAAGALAALAYREGADDQTVAALVDRFSLLPDRTNEGMATAWAQARQEIYTRRLAQVAGRFEVTLSLYAQNPTQRAAAPTSTIALGVVPLAPDGNQIRLGNGDLTLQVPAERLAIRIPAVTELKNLQRPEINALPLETVMGPLDLLPQADGRWVGHVQLDGNQWLQLELKPAA